MPSDFSIQMKGIVPYQKYHQMPLLNEKREKKNIFNKFIKKKKEFPK